MPESQPLSAAQRSKIRRLSRPKELSPDEEGGELNIVPFLDIVVNILIFVLATVSVTFVSSIETTPPAVGGGGVRETEQKPALNLTVLISSEGFGIKTANGNVSTGCTSAGSGLAVPKRSGDYDYNGLRQCGMRLKKASPEFAEESQVLISANNNVDYQTIVNTMDALRSDKDNQPLFPEVNFGAAQ